MDTDVKRKNPEMECPAVRDLLPLRELGQLSHGESARVEAHLDGCTECAGEAAFLTRVAALRAEPPAGFAARVVAEVEAGRVARATNPGHRTLSPAGRRGLAWALPAAAALILSLGIGAFWNSGSGSATGWEGALDAPNSTWGDEEWMVAGAPQLGGLSDDILWDLLEESN